MDLAVIGDLEQDYYHGIVGEKNLDWNRFKKTAMRNAVYEYIVQRKMER